MAIDFKLDESHDIAIENNDWVLVSGHEEVAQSAKIRLLFIQAEWVYDLIMGIPWIDDMFSIGTSLREKEDIIKNTILQTQGVLSLVSFEFGIDPINKGALIEFEAKTIYGNIDLTIGV